MKQVDFFPVQGIKQKIKMRLLCSVMNTVQETLRINKLLQVDFFQPV